MAHLNSANSCQDSVENHLKRESNEMTDEGNGAPPTQSDVASSETLDAIPSDDNLKFTVFDCILLLWCLGSFIFDTGSDLVMCFLHYHNGNMWYFGLTVTFVVVPALTMTGFSLRWYLLDENNQEMAPVSRVQWVVRVVFLILQLGPIIRYVDTLWYGFKVRASSRKEALKEVRDYYCKMVYEDSDAAMLRLFECYMESAPQLVLQLFIQAKSPYPLQLNWKTIVPWFSILFSLISLATSLVSYQSALRRSLPDKCDLSRIGKVGMFFWRFFVIASRVVALSLFASYSPVALAIFCVIHWFVMTAWIISMKTNFYDNKCEEWMYDAVLGVQFIFCYFNPVDRPTRYRYTIYYFVAFVENTTLMFIWYAHSDPEVWYRVAALYLQFTSFPVGIMFMLIYYLKCHPTGRIEVWRSKEKRCPLQPNPLQSPHSLEEQENLNPSNQNQEVLEDYEKKNNTEEQFVPQKENLNVPLKGNDVVIQELPSQNNLPQTEIRPILEQGTHKTTQV
ncbi:XK-related protein 6-like [Tachypleus tridentatus]|uniref:XK-related protein 6-like n=1 Tax=Tachypleus tridentatus TaxID=6853 RepID=UPI003FD2B278